MTRAKALMVIGSPRGRISVSRALARFLAGELTARGMDVSEITLPLRNMGDGEIHSLLDEWADSNLVVLAFPLYVDQLPAPVVAFLEAASIREGATERGNIRLAAIVQCGFPEARHNNTAVEILRHFADDRGYAWAGCLNMGMGGMVGGGRLDPRRGPLRRAARALQAAAVDLAAGKEISSSARDEFRRRPIPRRLYTFMANLGFRRLARRNGVYGDLKARPYAS